MVSYIYLNHNVMQGKPPLMHAAALGVTQYSTFHDNNNIMGVYTLVCMMPYSLIHHLIEGSSLSKDQLSAWPLIVWVLVMTFDCMGVGHAII